ncbi:MAG: adenylate/guanylate cyclase domain-containing protein [Bacteroidota bacterium]
MIFFLFITVEASALSSTSTDSVLFYTPFVEEIEIPFEPDNLPFLSLFVDGEGVIYLGRENSLFIVTGQKTLRYNLPGPVFLTADDNDSVYYTCDNDFGKIQTDENRNFSLKSIAASCSDAPPGFRPTGICFKDTSLFVSSSREIYCYNGRNLATFRFDLPVGLFFRDRQDLYVCSGPKDIFRWTGKDFRKLSFEKDRPDGSIVRISGNNDNLFIISRDGLKRHYFLRGEKLYLHDEIRISPSELLASASPESRFRYRIMPGKGMYIADREERGKYFLGPSQGFTFTDFISCLEDKNANLWLLLNHGLYKMENPSVFARLEFQKNITGRINATKIFQDKLFVAGSNGLFLLEPGKNSPPELIKLSGSASEDIFLLESSGKRLFAAGNLHLYSYEDNLLSLMDSGQYYQLLPVNEDTLLTIGKEGLVGYQRLSGKNIWQSTPVDPLLVSVHSSCNFSHSLWMVSENNQILRTEYKHFSYPPEPLASFRDNVILKLSGDRLYAFTGDSVFRYDEAGERFIVDRFTDNLSLLGHSGLSFSGSSDSTAWLVVNRDGKSSLWCLNGIASGSSSLVYPFASEIKEITGIGVIGDFLFVTDDQSVHRLNLNARKDRNPAAPGICISSRGVNRFTSGNVQVNTSDWKKYKSFVRLRYRDRNFTVSVCPENHITGNRYSIRYRITPHMEQWSGWESGSAFQVSGLKSGKFLLEVQQVDEFGRVSGSTAVPFAVRVPLFRHWLSYVAYLLLLVVLIFLINKWRLFSIHKMETRAEEKVKDQIDELVREKEKSDKLVADMFPKTTAEELKSSGRAKWDKYEMATVLFSDIQGFTKIAEHMNPELLIDELDKFFFHFDSVVDKFNIEKIKTIGDAYMAAGGIPEKNSTNPVEVVLAALEMQQYMHELKKSNTDIWDLRIGIHTGPVIAGVVGHKKLSYDIWGDTVNTASRMESSGIAGKVNISGTTYSLVKNYFICEYRGKLPVKYKGNIDMYFVNGLRPELTVDLAGIPNKRFSILLQTLRLNDLEEKIFETYLEPFDYKFHFHRTPYFIKFLDQIRLLCRAEELNEEDTLICLTSGLLLYSGLSQTYDNFENRSVIIARELLPSFRYSDKQIDVVVNTILGAKYPFDPRNIKEKILIDAKMEYLSRPDLPEIMKQLFLEARENGFKSEFGEWKAGQIKLLREFSYFTLASRRLREIQADEQIRILESQNWS